MLPLLLISALTTGAIFQTATVQGPTSYYGYITGIEKQATAYSMLGKVNAARRGPSVGALKWDATLESAAVTRAKEAAIYFFPYPAHSGASWYTVCSKLNAENLYVGYQASASTANSGWMNSSGHRANRLNSSYKSYAAAAFQKDGAVYWVELFSKTTSESAAYRGVDTAKKDLPVKMTDGYLSPKGNLTDSNGGFIETNTMRMGGSYFLRLKNQNKQFTYSYTTFSKGAFASANTAIATIDRVTGKITPVRAGVVKFGRKLQPLPKNC